MIASSLLIGLLSSGPSWPPPSPDVTVDGVVVGAQLHPAAIEAHADMCAKEVHTVAANDCRITRVDGGVVGFTVLGGSGQRCDVVADRPPRERRWVFGDGGRLREEISIDKRTAKAGGKMYRWADDRLIRIETWSDFKAGNPVEFEAFVYDEDGKVIEFSVQAPPSAPRRFLHAWHDGKIRTTTAIGTGTTWTYAYEGKRLTSVRERETGDGPIVETRYQYDKKGRLQSEERAVGSDRVSWTGWSYDKEGRPISKATDDRGTLPQGGADATGTEAADLAQRPDGQWDRTTRYYYDCAWIVAVDEAPAPPPKQP